jgi:EmrB/QacA subfamily drug resistance transporter
MNQGISQTAWALAGLSLCVLLSSLGTSIANVALPTLAQAFEASFQATQWTVLAYLLAITTLIVSAGRLGDIVGRRRLLLAGLAVFTVASAACAAAPTLWFLIVARAAQGMGAAVMMTLAMALVTETVPKERTGGAMGLLGTMSAAGTALGPSLGGLLIALLGWQAIFVVTVPLGAAALLIAHRFLPADASTAKPTARFDVWGTLLLALTLASYALAMTIGGGVFGALNVALLALASGGVALFVFSQTRVMSPLIHLSMFRDAGLGAALAASLLVATVLMATLIVGPFYLSQALGLETAAVGLVMTVGPLVAALAGVPAGRIVDRLGERRMAIGGLLGIGAGSVLLALSPMRLGIAGYVIPLVVLTAGYAMFQAANNTLVMKRVDAARRGVVSGMLNLSRNLGLVTGASLMGAVFAFASGSGETAPAPESVAFGMRITFAMSAVLIAAALAITSSTRSIVVPARAS